MQIVISQSVEGIGRRVRQKFKLNGYVYDKAPTMFYGVYTQNDVNRILNHSGPALVVWCGNDSSRAHLVEQVPEEDSITCWAKSESVQERLFAAGRKNVLVVPISGVEPTVKMLLPGKQVYTYGDGAIYRGDVIKLLRDQLPPREVIWVPKPTLPQHMIFRYYERCYAGIRLTKEDGLSNTVLEMTLMGRPCVTLQNLPYSYMLQSEPNVDSLTEALRHVKRMTHGEKKELAEVAAMTIRNGDQELEAWGKSAVNTQVLRKSTVEKLPRVLVLMNERHEDPNDIAAAIASITAQEDVEVTIVLHRSEPKEELNFLYDYPEVAVLESQVRGVYHQLNLTLSRMTGDFGGHAYDYVCYFSANDTMRPGSLRMQVAALEAEGASVCYTDYTTGKPGGMLRTQKFHDYSYNRHLPGNFVADVSLVKWDVFQKYMPFDTRWGNHAFHDLWLRMAKDGHTFAYLEEATWHYHRDPNSSSMKRKANPEAQRANQELREKIIAHHLQQAAQ